MLRDVLAAYLTNVDERAFDVPFMTVIRSAGFTDIHLTHGATEFGKDVIAKATSEAGLRQYAFQAKAGSLRRKSDWRPVREQLLEACTNPIAHPNFDSNLPLCVVLVITGDLHGHAAVDAQQFRAFAEDKLGVRIEIWSQTKLLELLTNAPGAALSSRSRPDFIWQLAACEKNEVTEQDLEAYSRRWISGDEWAGEAHVIEAAVICEALRRAQRADLAWYLAACGLRSSWARIEAMQAADPDSAVTFAQQLLVAESEYILSFSAASLTLDERQFWIALAIRQVPSCHMP